MDERLAHAIRTRANLGDLAQLEGNIRNRGLLTEGVRAALDERSGELARGLVADRMQVLFEAKACDGFVVAPTVFPGIFEEITTALVPELQRRGVFRRDYTGRTLRENLFGTLR